MVLKHLNIFFGVFILCLFSHQGFAQGNKLFVTALDENEQPIPKVEVLVDSFYAAVTKPDGKLIISMKTTDDPKSLTAVKNGFAFKDWGYDTTSREITIHMVATGLIKGKVTSKKGSLPVPNVEVLLIGTRAAPAHTNKKGEFTIKLPADISPNLPKKYAVYSFGLESSDFEFYERNGLSNIRLQQMPAHKVKVAYVIDNITKKPIADLLLTANGKEYTSDQNGYIKFRYALSTKNEFKLQGYQVVNLAYDERNATLRLRVQQALSNVSDTVVVTTRSGERLIVKVDEFNNLLAERNKNLSTERSQLEKEADAIKKKLDSGDVSDEERIELKRKLDAIFSSLARNRKVGDSIENIRQKVLEEVNNKLKLAQIQSDLAKKNAQTLQLEQKAAKARSQRNNLIFGSIATILLLIAIAFFMFNRRNRKQNKLLGEKVTEINRKNEMLEESKTILDRKNAQLSQQRHEMERQHTKITDSIRYALTIQEAILPAQELITAAFKDHFILYKPKDIVGGDFYWFAQKGDNYIISAIDCTGHGVPGGFMTMIGNTLLNQIVKEDNITDPKEILTQLNIKVKETLKEQVKDEGRDGDGMDLGILNFDMANKTATFCGAKTPLFYVKNGEITYLKGTNISIGSTLSRKKKEFKSHTITFEEGDQFYLASDGFQDQLGGPNNGKQKFLKKTFIALIEEVSVYPPTEQIQRFEEALAKWQGAGDQTDDIVILGLKV
ncbi:SpoIIE family protein phosphatase [uncultured Microscilla sp.]|uniref:SpoIIE family protein phosphatase n=1 Tax=uncultured Microscilla sp. TaxID=432653 RepID=UPI002619F1E4|nr:SpoIIE family protein phosphatase [uncultured Microscilla sp.]